MTFSTRGEQISVRCVWKHVGREQEVHGGLCVQLLRLRVLECRGDSQTPAMQNVNSGVKTPTKESGNTNLTVTYDVPSDSKLKPLSITCGPHRLHKRSEEAAVNDGIK